MREFWSSPSFLPSKPSFLHDHFTIQHSDFPSFLAVSTTDKPVNRNIHALPLKLLNVLALRGFIFRDIHKKQGRSSSKSGYRIQKICGWKIYSHTRTFDAEVHKSNIRVKKLAQQVWKWWIRMKDKFCFIDLLTNSNRTEIQTYKVEERTFGDTLYFFLRLKWMHQTLIAKFVVSRCVFANFEWVFLFRQSFEWGWS